MKKHPLSSNPRSSIRRRSPKGQARRDPARHRRLLLESLEQRLPLATFTVTNTLDTGAGSLRSAITSANGTAGQDIIEFNIAANDARHFYYRDDGAAGQVTLANVTPTSEADDANIADIDADWTHSWFSIQPASVLPNITQSVFIDGYTQPGASANTNSVESGLGLDTVLRVELTGLGLSSGSGLTLDTAASGGSTIQGLVVNGGNQRSIMGLNSSGNTVAGNFLGTDPSGTQGIFRQIGVEFRGSLTSNINNLVGGLTPEARNLISGNQEGVRISNNGNGNKIQGNLIGTDRSGTRVIGNRDQGVVVHGPRNTLIGGTEPGARNIISGNVPVSGSAGDGIQIVSVSTLGTVIEGNYIGLDVSGTNRLRNSWGISDGGTGMRVGGPTAAQRNIISANTWGIRLSAPSNAVVQGNYIGTDKTGMIRDPDGIPGNGDELGNSVGVSLNFDTSGCLIGGPNPSEGNVISGNTTGILLTHFQTENNRIQGNLIGLAADGSTPLGNTSHGVSADNVARNDGIPNVIGGTLPGEGNVIAYNGGDGVNISGSTGDNFARRVSVFGNSIFANTGLGIDINGGAQNAFGVTANDTGDADSGANTLQNYPVLNSVTADVGATIEGTLSSTTDTIFRIEFFSSPIPSADPSGFGEGRTYLGAHEVTTDATGNTGFSAFLPVSVPVGFLITATASPLIDHDANSATALVPTNTSEFSQAVAAEPPILQPETWVNDDWHFVADVDGSGDLSHGDKISNDNDVAGPTGIQAFYGVAGFGSVKTGAFTGAVPGLDRITDAVATTQVGGTVTLLQGTYFENAVIDRHVVMAGATGKASDVVIDALGGVALSITSAVENVAIKHFRVTGAAGSGIQVDGAAGDITFQNIEAMNNPGYGISLIGVGHVTFAGVVASGNLRGAAVLGALSFTDTNSQFSLNADHGLWLQDVVGSLTLEGTTLERNDADADGIGHGLFIDQSASHPGIAGNVSVTNVIAGANGGDGVHVAGVRIRPDSFGSITIGHLTTSENRFLGLNLTHVAGDVSLHDISAGNNGEDGIRVQASRTSLATSASATCRPAQTT